MKIRRVSARPSLLTLLLLLAFAGMGGGASVRAQASRGKAAAPAVRQVTAGSVLSLRPAPLPPLAAVPVSGWTADARLSPAADRPAHPRETPVSVDADGATRSRAPPRIS